MNPALSPLIEVQPPGSAAARTITTAVGLKCHTILSVAKKGAADSKFGTEARCQLRQDSHASDRSAKLISRDPVNAFFRLGAGRVVCTFKTSPKRIPLCGMGIVFVTGFAQAVAECDRDPVFQVAVFAGSVRVLDPRGASFLLRSGRELTFDFRTHRAILTAVTFSAEDIAVFDAQAKAMHLTAKGQGGNHGGGSGHHNGLRPQTITFTSEPPVNPSHGDTYTVSATGGGSGNPVIFTIDPSSVSTKVCTINTTTNTVAFSGAGTCIIDANQAGNAQYQAAPQAQQSITVVAPG